MAVLADKAGGQRKEPQGGEDRGAWTGDSVQEELKQQV